MSAMSHRVKHLVGRSLAILLMISAAHAALGDTAAMLPMVPEDANVLVLVDVNGLHNSPLGVREEWAKQHESRYLEGATSFPPTTRAVILASQLHPGTLHNDWEIGIVELDRSPSMAAVAKAEGGKRDRVADVDVAWSPRNAFFATIGPNTVGIMAPADRQALLRWLRAKPKAPRVSDYLKAAAEVAQEGQIVMAIDLDGVVAPAGARDALERSQTLAGKASDLDRFARVVASLKGVTFAVRVDESIIGKVRIDFGESTESLGQYAKPLVLEALGNKGAMIDDFQNWAAKVEGTSISLQGKLSQSGMRKLLSMVQLPSDPLGATDEKAGKPESPGQVQATASQRYFRATQAILDELREKKGATQGQNAFWHEKYAEKIDRLPMLNVDEALLDYGNQVGESLRNIAYSLRGVGIRTSAQQAAVYGGYHDGYYNQYDRSAERRRIGRQETAKGVTDRFSIWKAIDDKTAEIRRQMTKKYGVEF